MMPRHLRSSVNLRKKVSANTLAGIFAVSTCICFAPASVSPTPAIAKAVASVRVIQFPKEQSIGAVSLAQYHNNMDERGDLQRVGAAQGTLKVTVPAGSYVFFEANRRVFQNPELLKEISPNGIDYLKIGFMSMDDSEDGLCNKALRNVEHLSGLTALNLDRSDANDAGLSVVGKLKNLQTLSCFHSEVNGSFLQNLVGLPDFNGLNVSWCALDPANFKYLPLIPKLDFVNLTKTGIGIEGALQLGKCTNLKNLRLIDNSKFDDECLKQLSSLKNLSHLELVNTPVTMKGLRDVRGLKLTYLSVPDRLDTAADVQELKQLFPGVKVHFKSRKVDEETRQTYAPLK